MAKRTGLILMVAFAALFLVINQGAYRGYFQDDEIDNLSWAPHLTTLDFLKGAVSPLFQVNNFRPLGHYYFHAVEAVAGLNFPVYVAVLHALHVFNVWLLWLIIRRMGAAPLAAAAACCFFGLHMALFDNFWKPMYVFDVLCTSFCLGSLLLWMKGHWLASLVTFWLAYKCKELAIMLPVVLGGVGLQACPGEVERSSLRKLCFRLAPFFAISLSFGLQAMLLNPNKDNDYTFRFTLAAIEKTLPYYAGRLFLVPYVGFLVPLLALLSRNRRVWFGLTMMALFFFPMLFLPGRIFSAYCYLPFTGLAIALSGVNAPVLAAFLALWLPMDIHELRLRRRVTLARDTEIHAWMNAAEAFAASREKVDAFVFSGAPSGFNRWGIEGALKYFYERQDLVIRGIDEPETKELTATKRVATIVWDGRRADILVTGPPR